MKVCILSRPECALNVKVCILSRPECALRDAKKENMHFVEAGVRTFPKVCILSRPECALGKPRSAEKSKEKKAETKKPNIYRV